MPPGPLAGTCDPRVDLALGGTLSSPILTAEELVCNRSHYRPQGLPLCQCRSRGTRWTNESACTREHSRRAARRRYFRDADGIRLELWQCPGTSEVLGVALTPERVPHRDKETDVRRSPQPDSP